MSDETEPKITIQESPTGLPSESPTDTDKPTTQPKLRHGFPDSRKDQKR